MLFQLCSVRMDVPDFLGVLADGAVGGKLARAGDVHQALAGEVIGLVTIVTVGGELSQESVLSIDDQALLETPRVCSVTNTSSAFVRNALILNGGVLQTREIDGAGWLDVEINGGIIRASAASTAASTTTATCMTRTCRFR